MNDKPKRDYSHLKKYHFKKGERPPGAGRKKGSGDKKKLLCIEILQDAIEMDSKTGKRLTTKELTRKISKIYDSNPRLLLDAFSRILGPVPTQVEQTQRLIVNIERAEPLQASKQTDKDNILDADIVQDSLPEGSDIE